MSISQLRKAPSGTLTRSTNGVSRLGKQLAQRIIRELESKQEPALNHNSSTNNLITTNIEKLKEAYMKSIGLNEQQLQKMKSHPGFIAALDQSGGSTPKALALYGIKEGAWSNEDEMFAIVHEMRTRMITSHAFNGRADHRRHPFREHDGQGYQWATYS